MTFTQTDYNNDYQKYTTVNRHKIYLFSTYA